MINKVKINFFLILVGFIFNNSFYGQIVATDDYGSTDYMTQYVSGNNGTTFNILGNDTLNNAQANASNVTITAIDVPAEFYMHTSPTEYPFGGIDYMGGNNAGSYVLTYKISETANVNNFAIAHVYVEVYYISPPSPIAWANDDDFSSTPISNIVGGTTTSVLNNDSSSDGYSTGTPSPNYTTLYYNSYPSGIIMNFDGTISVAIGTTPGTYSLQYSFYEYTYSNPAQITIVVTGPSNLLANYDDFSSIPLYAGNTTSSILTNDTINGIALNAYDITIVGLNIPNGFTINSSGAITVDSSVTVGTYNIPYQICSISTPTNCSVNYAHLIITKNRINGKIRFDSNNNGCDITDQLLNYMKIKNTLPTINYETWAYNSGQYSVLGDFGVNTVSLEGLPSYFTVTPVSQVFNFTTPSIVNNADFCVNTNALVDDLAVYLIPAGIPRPGFQTNYFLQIVNRGSTTLSGQVTVQFDNTKESFISGTTPPISVTTNSATFDFSNIAPFENRKISRIYFQINTPPTVNAGDIVSLTSIIVSAGINDITPSDNSLTIYQTVVNSYDPNNVIVQEGEFISPTQATKDLTYTINFQNTGTANAINIIVAQDLDLKLNWNTLQILNTSHNCRIEKKNGHVDFHFDNINLSDSTSNEPLSHGFITYKIKPATNFAVGDIISSSANIYFDYNLPIVTNTATTTIQLLGSNDFETQNKVELYPNPVNNILNINSIYDIKNIEIDDINGRKILNSNPLSTNITLDISKFSKGIYFIKLTSDKGVETKKILKE